MYTTTARHRSRRISVFAASALVTGALSATVALPGVGTAGASQHQSSPAAAVRQAAVRMQAKQAKFASHFSALSTKVHHFTTRYATSAAKATPLGAIPTTTQYLTTIHVATTHDVTRTTTRYETCTANPQTCSLRSAVETADALETNHDPTGLPVLITLPAGTYHLTSKDAQNFSAIQVLEVYGLVIKGAGETATTIVANTTVTTPDRVFDVGAYFTASDLTLSTLTVEGGRAPFRSKIMPTYTHCRSTTSSSGGDIADCNTRDVLIVNHVRVTAGSAKTAGGIFAQGPTWIVDSRITGNVADQSYTSTLTSALTSTLFRGDFGGGIITLTSLDLVDTTISNNEALGTLTTGVTVGGGLFSAEASYLTVSGGTFSTNQVRLSTSSLTAFAAGGAFFLDGESSITGGTFDTDVVTAQSSSRNLASGGAIFDEFILESITSSTFDHNYVDGAAAAGGAVEVTSELLSIGAIAAPLLASDDFEHNTVVSTLGHQAAIGGAIAEVTANYNCGEGLDLTHDTIRSNTASTTGATLAMGGGVAVYELDPTCVRNSIVVSDSTVSDNSAHSNLTSSMGGGIFALDLGQNLTVTETTFSHNSATNETTRYPAAGGGIGYLSAVSVHFTDDVFDANSVTNSTTNSYGGAIAEIGGDGGVTSLLRDSISSNSAQYLGGGAVFVTSVDQIVDSTFSSNMILGTGGFSVINGGAGAFISTTRTTVLDSTFSTNQVRGKTTSDMTGAGGAIFGAANYVQLVGDTITANSASLGGALHLAVIQSGLIADSVVSGNVTADPTPSLVGKPTNCITFGFLTNGGGNYLGISTLATGNQVCVAGADATVGTAPLLAPLADNGGGRQTRVPEAGSPLLGGGGATCSGDDEIARARPSNDCTIGAYQETVGAGYTSVASDGGVFAFPTPLFHGSTGALTLAQPMVSMASTPDGLGYWLVASDGGVFAFGDAGYFGSMPGSHLSTSDIVGIASTPDGLGYWLVGADGAVYAFGAANYMGSLPGSHLSASDIVGIGAHGTDGYWLVAADGAIYAYGSARYEGGANTLSLNRPIVGIAADPAGEGYWLVAADGGIFAYGSVASRFYGSMGGQHLNQPIVGIAATNDAKGYWLVAADGGIFAYGDASFKGSTGDLYLNKPVVGIA